MTDRKAGRTGPNLFPADVPMHSAKFIACSYRKNERGEFPFGFDIVVPDGVDAGKERVLNLCFSPEMLGYLAQFSREILEQNGFNPDGSAPIDGEGAL